MGLDEFREEQRLEDLRSAHHRTLRALDREKDRTAQLVSAVYQAARDAMAALELPPVKPPPSDRRRKGEEVAVSQVSDLQLAKVTPTYNTEVCEQRMEVLGDKVTSVVADHRTSRPVKQCRVYVTGDIVEGELIFPGQSHLIDASLYRQVTVDGPRILGGYLRRLLGLFDRVHVVAVIGNHGALGGRSRRDYNPESNADRMLYRIVQQMLAHEKRLTWHVPDGPSERNWYAVDRVGQYGAFLFHGDQVRGALGFPWYGFGKKVQGWANGSIPELRPKERGGGGPVSEFVCGHWHQACVFPINMLRVRCSGSTESDNTYAQENLAAAGRPSQWLWFVRPDRTYPTADYCLYLD